ncbi:helix-turn-helix domain-containing protein [Tepidanaerobacter syntrophicus]|uniref:helix-turn-helix domain-containing protein n=1 Tax=Tepidanaerobacter syntrophicus TaxID=224999 RepID=UPI0023555259|nr:helix-turn-helix transcriptional regulator [Tepidanaerobacter syntrophicus]
MPISYKKLFHILVDRNLSAAKLSRMSGVAQSTISKLRRDEVVQTDVIEKICAALDCQPGDIMDYIPEETE